MTVIFFSQWLNWLKDNFFQLNLNSVNLKLGYFSSFFFLYFDKNECAFIMTFEFWPIFIKPFWSSFLVFGLAVTWHAIKLNYKIWFDSHESESFYFSDCTFVLYYWEHKSRISWFKGHWPRLYVVLCPPIPNSTVHM